MKKDNTYDVQISPAKPNGHVMLGRCKREHKNYHDDKMTMVGDLGLILTKFSEPEYWEPQHMYLTCHDELQANDYCLFYGQLSHVLEVNDTHAKIETRTQMSANDVEFMNEIKGTDYKPGQWSTMVHSYSISQLKKVVASTDNTLKNTDIISMDYLNQYINDVRTGDAPKTVKIDLKNGHGLVLVPDGLTSKILIYQ